MDKTPLSTCKCYADTWNMLLILSKETYHNINFFLEFVMSNANITRFVSHSDGDAYFGNEWLFSDAYSWCIRIFPVMTCSSQVLSFRLHLFRCKIFSIAKYFQMKMISGNFFFRVWLLFGKYFRKYLQCCAKDWVEGAGVRRAFLENGLWKNWA